MIKDRMYEQASINTERQEKGNFQKRPRLQFLVIHEGLTRRYICRRVSMCHYGGIFYGEYIRGLH